MRAVKDLREAEGWTQNQLAFHAGLATSVVSQVENGKRDPSASTLKKLAEALGVNVSDLFRGEEAPKAQAPLSEEDGRRSKALAGMHEAAADLGGLVAASFTNLKPGDVERVVVFQKIEAALAQLSGRDIWGRDPDRLAEAKARLSAASDAVQVALQEHLDFTPANQRSGLDAELAAIRGKFRHAGRNA
jgi:transcriptional regulator with XRE-family HTH domain